MAFLLSLEMRLINNQTLIEANKSFIHHQLLNTFIQI